MIYTIPPTTFNGKHFRTLICLNNTPVLTFFHADEKESRMQAVKTAMLIAIEESEEMYKNTVHP